MKASLVSGAARSIRQIRVPPQQGMSNSHSGKSSDEKNYDANLQFYFIFQWPATTFTSFLNIYLLCSGVVATPVLTEYLIKACVDTMGRAMQCIGEGAAQDQILEMKLVQQEIFDE